MIAGEGAVTADCSAVLLELLAPVDAAGDRMFDRLRGRSVPDTVAAAISNLADYGLAWSLLAAVKGRRRGPARRRAVRTLALAGTSSATLNAVLKSGVGRRRPDADGPDLPVRSPTSSSFPSGHTLAAFCTAVALADRPAESLAYVGFATAVGASRIHLGAHHPSDVVGGAIVGTALGLAVRRLVGRTV